MGGMEWYGMYVFFILALQCYILTEHMYAIDKIHSLKTNRSTSPYNNGHIISHLQCHTTNWLLVTIITGIGKVL